MLQHQLGNDTTTNFFTTKLQATPSNMPYKSPYEAPLHNGPITYASTTFDTWDNKPTTDASTTFVTWDDATTPRTPSTLHPVQHATTRYSYG
ncbi:hypothetical protein Pcinc_003174 [Petrolisthes cinctipes]|uniref:Uncharacterized protein n=1 Tax=Petrolisthes cinctipes TaxID=88211 RepID=A0AAE1GHT1_PETCI|nr:hypothetical protein Pcinc_003174 [Petrolisthes cinctipes]